MHTESSKDGAKRPGPLLSSARGDWETPPELFADLVDWYGTFDLDAAASAENALCARFYADRSLERDWTVDYDGYRFSRVYVNPPYGRGVGAWVAKAAEAAALGVEVVMLLPARTDTVWFHAYIWKKQGVEVTFLRGRIKFRLRGEVLNPAPFPSMVVVFRAVPQCA